MPKTTKSARKASKRRIPTRNAQLTEADRKLLRRAWERDVGVDELPFKLVDVLAYIPDAGIDAIEMTHFGVGHLPLAFTNNANDHD